MMEGFKVPREPHPDEPDELTPDTLPLDDVERPHDGGQGPDDPDEPAAKDLDEPGPADRTPRP
ncbi:MAG TPA: hypothetical protein VK838_04650 [Candidatus Limnocylindrales bacterium]|nr:hypothetical protein [Candidatus Limnocylindrales bacterium]